MSSSINGGSPVRRAYDDIRASTEGEKEEGVVDVQNEPLPPIFQLPPEVLVLIFNYAAGSDQPGDAKTLCLIRRVCHLFNRLSDDVLRMYWTQLGNGRVPALHSLVTAIERRIGGHDLSYFSRFHVLTEVFGRIGVPIPKKDPETAIQPLLGFQPLQYVQAHQELDAALQAIWPKIREWINFGQNPVPDNAEAIRQWLNDPENAGRLAQFTELNLINLRLKILPPEIGKLTGLQKLFLGNNQLTTLPPEIGDLAQLQSLDLNKNRLATLPPEIGHLTRLQSLDLTENQLSTLPPEIGYLIGLDTLSLDYNRLVSLPSEISNLKLPALYLEGNPIMSVLCLENPGAWKAYEIRESEARENIARHIACSSHRCQSSFAALCQAIQQGVGDEALREHFEALSPEMQRLIYNNWESQNRNTRGALLSSLSSSSQPWGHLLVNRELFANAVISVVREKFRAANKFPMYERVWELAGSPALKGWQQSKCSWGKEHAADNIIRLIDAMELISH